MSVDLSGLEQQYSLPTGLLSAVQQQESGGDPNAVNDDTATGEPSIGAFQFQPETAKQYGIDPTDPDQAAKGAAMMFSDLSKKYNGDVPSMLAAYNWGQGNVDRKGLENAPEETQNYIKTILPKLSKGTQYAQADTGNMTDASVDSGIDPSKLSDADLDAQIAKLQGSQAIDPSKLSDEELDAQIAKLQGQQQPQSLIDALQNPSTRGVYQATMNTVAKPINNAVSGAMGAAASLIPQAAKTGAANAAQGASNAIDSTDAGQWLGDKLLGAKNAISDVGANVKDLESYNPDLEKDLSALGENAQLAGNIGLAKPVSELAGATLGKSGALEAMAANEYAPAAAKAVKATAYNPITTHSAISDAYGAAKQNAVPYYNLMRDIASGETADASELKPALDSMISDIQNTPFHEASSELPYLKQQAVKIGDDGTMPLNDMIKLRQSLNNNFNPKRFAQGADTPYANVGKLVDDSLNDAAERIPEFGDAKALADKNWLNTVKSPFEDNTVLQKFWQPEDYYAKKSVDNGMLEELPDPTQQRAANMLKNIKNPVQLNAVRRALSPDLSNALSQAKIQDITQGSGLSRLSAAGKTIMGAPNLTLSGMRNTLTNLGETIGGVPLKQSEKDLINAAKQPSPALSTKYQKPFSSLKSSIQQQSDLADEMQPYGPPEPAQPKPKPPLMLPAPETPWVNTGEQTVIPSRFRPMTQEEYAASNTPEAVATRNARADQTPPNILNTELRQRQAANEGISAWDKAAKNLSDKGLAYKEIINKLGKRPEAPPSFAKGGIIKNREIHLSKKLEVKLGRKPKTREVELATYVGAHGVHRLLNQKDVKLAAHKMFPEKTVSEKRELFFNKKKPYTVEDIKAALG